MSSSIYELKFTFMDVMQLFCVEGKGKITSLPNNTKRECWRIEPYVICLDGIFIDTEHTEDVALTPAERQAYMSHPEGDPSVPLVEFPCTLENLRKFANYDREGRIDPFDLAEMVASKMVEIDVRSFDKIISKQEPKSFDVKFPLYAVHLMEMAIDVQHKYWKYLENPHPSQQAIVKDLMAKHGISAARARAIEQVACPIER